MRIIILGGDGYLGWPAAMHLSALGHDICIVDNYLHRRLAEETSSHPLLPVPHLPDRVEKFAELTGYRIDIRLGDCADAGFMSELFQEIQPEVVVHCAEQPSAPYSMRGLKEAQTTLLNNIGTTFNTIWAVKTFAPDCHIVKFGTMGEYGTPNIDIEEGWIEIEHEGRSDKFLFPRAGGSLYHTTKIMDTDLLWFYVRVDGLRVTDLMQGPVYGISTEHCDMDERLMSRFHYDDIFGTVVNRFLLQAVAEVPLTVYGQGGQTRGFINILDTLDCVRISIENPPKRGELRILNQFTEMFTLNTLAKRVAEVGLGMGLNVQIRSVDNPRQEMEAHYYAPKHQTLLDLGLEPRPMTDDVIAAMIERLLPHRNRIRLKQIMPRVRW